ncbi:MAG: hypothetical protein ACRCVG_03425 [Methanobacteriaceae archaeon]
MHFKLWVSTNEAAEWVINNTSIKKFPYKIEKLVESDARNPKLFHRLPEPIKRILYLDAHDIIIEYNKKPILAVEISHEAGTGHNVFQRFGRLAAAAENNVPIAYIYPEATFITRKNKKTQPEIKRWDKINPSIFRALEKLMRIHKVPSLLYYFPTEYDGDPNKVPSSNKGHKHDKEFLSHPDSSDDEIISFFEFVDLTIEKTLNEDNISLLNERLITDRRDWMQEEYVDKGGTNKKWSPESATIEIPTECLIDHLKQYSEENYCFGDYLDSKKKTIIYKVNAVLRGDPYPGALVALDYLKTRIGGNIEDRDKNLVMAWCDLEYDSVENKLRLLDGKTSINNFMESVHSVRDSNKCLLALNNFKDLDYQNNTYKIPRYYMQVKHGCNFTKNKEIRVYSAFADAIIFKDGSLWKEG